MNTDAYQQCLQQYFGKISQAIELTVLYVICIYLDKVVQNNSAMSSRWRSYGLYFDMLHGKWLVNVYMCKGKYLIKYLFTFYIPDSTSTLTEVQKVTLWNGCVTKFKSGNIATKEAA